MWSGVCAGSGRRRRGCGATPEQRSGGSGAKELGLGDEGRGGRHIPVSAAAIGARPVGGCGGTEGGRAAGLPPKLLREVLARVEESKPRWPRRRDVVACATVSRSWRGAVREIIRVPEVSGTLTFPISVKQEWVITLEYLCKCGLDCGEAADAQHQLQPPSIVTKGPDQHLLGLGLEKL